MRTVSTIADVLSTELQGFLMPGFKGQFRTTNMSLMHCANSEL